MTYKGLPTKDETAKTTLRYDDPWVKCFLSFNGFFNDLANRKNKFNVARLYENKETANVYILCTVQY